MAQLRALEPNNPQLSTLTGPNYVPNQAAIDTVTVELTAARSRATVIQNIEQGGPFPYTRDGVVFNNREGLLPAQPSGYYQEYTMPTPGASGRGAQRIVIGRGEEVYYKSDHYNSFQRIR
jgi:ribonuclease T1